MVYCEGGRYMQVSEDHTQTLVLVVLNLRVMPAQSYRYYTLQRALLLSAENYITKYVMTAVKHSSVKFTCNLKFAYLSCHFTTHEHNDDNFTITLFADLRLYGQSSFI
jgi:hypothetical protein